MSAAGLANPSPSARSLSREIERVYEETWAVFKRHITRCQICAGQGSGGDLCTVGEVLRSSWVRVNDLRREPSRWHVVEVTR